MEKPGRDPRPEFRTATFAEGVHKIADLRPGMLLEGVVTNVAAFGAFVDVGVHQDGLVHVSAMSKNFVSDPREVVKSGDVVRVKVLEVDEARKRISLTLRLDDEVSPKQPRTGDQRGGDRGPRDQKGRPRDQKGGPRDQKGGPRDQKGGPRDQKGAQRSDQRGRGGDRRGGGGRQGGGSGGSGGSGGGLGNSAMADALRRAGLTGDRKD